MFQPQSYLRDAVNNKDIEQVRVALSTYLSKNPTNEQNEVIQAAEYAENRLTEPLWVQHDGLFIEKDSNKWTIDYLGQLKSDLRHNFSKERFIFIIEVGKKVRPYKGVAKTPQAIDQPIYKPDAVTTSQQSNSDPKPSPVRNAEMGKSNKKWLVIAGLGGLAILTIAIILTIQDQQ